MINSSALMHEKEWYSSTTLPIVLMTVTQLLYQHEHNTTLSILRRQKIYNFIQFIHHHTTQMGSITSIKTMQIHTKQSLMELRLSRYYFDLKFTITYVYTMLHLLWSMVV